MKKSPSKFVNSLQLAKYLHTDLACESPIGSRSSGGVDLREFSLLGFDAAMMHVSSASGEDATGRAMGKYITLHCPQMTCPETLDRENLALALSRLLRRLILQGGFEISGKLSVLIAGLGNRFITSDSIGPRSCDKILATAHLNKSSPAFAALDVPSVSVISPGVSSQTGMESATLIRSAAEAAEADLVIAIDALAARSTERLCATIQLSDSGINPGSGIGNHRTAINREAIGVPVISIGIPTVISSATLILDAIEGSGSSLRDSRLEEILSASEGFFVSHGESDCICEGAADVISRAISETLTDKIYS